ncbi:MAG: ATP-grasp domain-containing protein [Candidatus Tectomicrobia bacterium]|nr:ATP-grasp domain-containing protein [Candidatus Tectomicrobia bacterium]
MARDPIGGSRLMLLYTTTGYEAREFVQTARRLGVEMLLGSDRCDVLDDPWEDDALALRFQRPDEAAGRIVDQVSRQPVDAILPVGDTPLVSAAQASRRLGMVHNAPDAVLASRNKHLMRLRLQSSGARVPSFRCFPMRADPHLIKHEVPYPCVVKPLALSASQGVIRANGPDEFAAAFMRVRTLLERPENQRQGDETDRGILVEQYIPGVEVALEGLITSGRLQTLALFDKPDPLNGPYFEETIYVTPSRLDTELQATITHCAEQAALALGLCHGPVHAEFRVNEYGPWLLELAARPIGGL